MKPFIILGTGGHGEVVCRLLKDLKYPIEGVCDPIFKEVGKDKSWNNLKVFGSDNALFKLDASKYNIAIGLGVKPSENKRNEVFEKIKKNGFSIPNLIHPFSYVAEDVILGEGIQIMAGSIIQTKVSIGDNCIINSRASIDHNSLIGKNTHVAPSSCICGDVHIGNNSYIGAGSTIIQGIKLRKNSFVKAASLVKENN